MCVGSLIFSISALSKTSVFEVSKDGHSFCIAGSIHLLRKQDYPLPKPFTECFDQRSKLVLELDLSNEERKSALQQQIMQLLVYSDGTTLKEVLSKPVYNQLNLFLKETIGNSKHFMSMTPQGLYITLSLLKFQLEGATVEGIDQYFQELAVEQNKSLEALETVEQQVNIMRSLGKGKEDWLISSLIETWDDIDVNDFFAWWKAGELEKIDNFMIKESPEFASFNQELLFTRNSAWLSKIMAMTRGNSDYYFIVGAAHLPGEKGVLNLLKQQGYEIKQL